MGGLHGLGLVQALTLVAMVAGLFLVATSPLVTRQQAPDTAWAQHRG